MAQVGRLIREKARDEARDARIERACPGLLVRYRAARNALAEVHRQQIAASGNLTVAEVKARLRAFEQEKAKLDAAFDAALAAANRAD